MESSGDETKKPKEFLVYQRKRCRNSEETLSNTEKEISSHAESSLDKKDDKLKAISSPAESSLDKKDNKLKGQTGEDGQNYECLMCGKGGELLCCEFCPRTFHPRCLKYETAPKGEWKCPLCEDYDDDSKPLIHVLSEIVAKRKKQKIDSSCGSSDISRRE